MSEAAIAPPVDLSCAFEIRGDVIHKKPVHTENGDGSTNITVGFPVCTVSKYVDAADLVKVLTSGEREPFQARVAPWMQECFGPVISADFIERNHRFLEEALELVQACGMHRSEALQLVDYVFARPIGDKRQESGGVSVTHAALCLANGMDIHECAETELARVWTKVEQIRAKQAAKPKHSPLPVASPESGQKSLSFSIDHLDAMNAALRGGSVGDDPVAMFLDAVARFDATTSNARADTELVAVCRTLGPLAKHLTAATEGARVPVLGKIE